MKITRRQLRRIIREEKKRILREAPRYMSSHEEKAAAAGGARRLPDLADALEMELDLLTGSVTPEEEQTLEAAVIILQRLANERTA
jgi:hypothetical protein